MGHFLLSVHNLTVKRKAKILLDAVSFDVKQGEYLAIIGPNGAGKSTLLKCLDNILTAWDGEVLFEGKSIRRIAQRNLARRIAYVQQSAPGVFAFTVRQLVEMGRYPHLKSLSPISETDQHIVDDAMQTMSITHLADRYVETLSGGEMQKVALSCALIHEPDVLFLDEPTTGVDPVSRREFWGMLRRLKERGITILVSTPYMDDATRCDRIALMLHGAFMTIDAPQDIIRRFDGALWAVSAEKMSPLLRDLQVMQGIRSCFAFGSAHHVTIDPAVMTSDALRRQLHDLGHTMIDVRPIDATIEDCFMQLLNDGRA